MFCVLSCVSNLGFSGRIARQSYAAWRIFRLKTYPAPALCPCLKTEDETALSLNHKLALATERCFKHVLEVFLAEGRPDKAIWSFGLLGAWSLHPSTCLARQENHSASKSWAGPLSLGAIKASNQRPSKQGEPQNVALFHWWFFALALKTTPKQAPAV